MSPSPTSSPAPSSCAHRGAAAGARFCPDCGDRLEGESPSPPPPQSTTISVHQQASEIGPRGITGVLTGSVHGGMVVHNNYHITDPSPAFLDVLDAAKRLSTEMQPPRTDGTAATGTNTPAAPGTLHAPRDLEQPLGRIIDQIRAAEGRGERVDSVTAGSLRFTRAELIIKEAVLLIADADQLFFDDAMQHEEDGGAFPGAAMSDDDADRMVADVEATYATKMRQALALLREARELEPTNAEVLLHLAKVMSALDESPREVQKVLHQVKRLLDPPRDDAERFHLAQATYLLAVAGGSPHAQQLQIARQLFASLGRGEWVRQCDEAMAWGTREYGGGQMPGGSPRAGAPPMRGGGPMPGAAPMGAHPTPAWFEPVGAWQAEISDGTAAHFTLYPNGMMQGMLMMPNGMQLPMGGQWGFDPGPGVLRFQGTVGGMRPLMLAIQMQGAVPGGYAGVGSDGLSYVLRRG